MMKTFVCTISIILVSTLSLFSQSDSLRINAHFEGFEEGTYLYLWTNVGGIGSIADSAQIQDKRFSITYKLLESPSVVYVAGKNFNPMIRFWTHNNSVTLTGKRETFKESSIEGSPINEVAIRLRGLNDHSDELIAYLGEHLDKEPAIQKLYFLLEKTDRETISKLYQKIPEALHGYDYSKRIQTYLALPNLEVPNIGDHLVDFEAYDAEGKNYSLADLNDRYLILEFGSSYCGPCFFAVPELSKLQEEQKDKLRIVSFSMDTRESNWRKGLERIAQREEFAHVLHIWDGEGENGAVPLRYGIAGIPVFYLFNPAGRVIDKWEGYREGEVLKHWKAAQKAE